METNLENRFTALKQCLKRFTTAFSMELRQIAWHWSYPLIHILWAALLVWSFYQRDDRSAMALLETTLGHMSLALVSLLCVFFTGMSATRTKRAKLQELEDTYPTGLEVILGKGLGILAAMMAFMVAPIVLAGLQGPFLALLAELPVFLGETLLSMALTTAAAWWLTAQSKMGRWAYPVLGVTWYAFVLIPLYYTQYQPALSLFNFYRQGISFYSEAWGRLVYAGLLDWFNLFCAGILLFLIGLLDWQYQSRRLHRFGLRTVLIGLAAAGIIGYSGSHYLSLLKNANILGSTGDVQKISSALNTVPESQLSLAQVISYNLLLDLQDPQQAKVTAQLTLRNTGAEPLQQAAFKLDPHLTIESVTVGSASQAFQRLGDELIIKLAVPLNIGEELGLEFVYAGTVWRTEFDSVYPIAQDFVHPKGVRLTPAIAWYPQPVTTPVPGAEALHAPTVIHLKITGSPLLFASNLPALGANEFKSESAGWVFLIGSPHLVFVQEGKVALVTTLNDLDRARNLARQYVKPLETFERFFPDIQVNGLTLMVLGEEGGLPSRTPPSAGQLCIVTSPYNLAWAEKSYYNRLDLVGYALAADLWSLGGGKANPPFDTPISTAANFLLLYQENGGDVDKMRANAIYDSTSLQALLDIYTQQGDAGVIQALAEMRKRSGEMLGIESDDLASWLRQVSHVQ